MRDKKEMNCVVVGVPCTTKPNFKNCTAGSRKSLSTKHVRTVVLFSGNTYQKNTSMGDLDAH